MTHLKKSAFTSRTYSAKKISTKRVASPPFLEKTHFLKKISIVDILASLIGIDTNLKEQKQDSKLCWKKFSFIHYFDNSTCYEIKGADYIFFQKKGLFSKFRGFRFYYWIKLLNLQ